VENEDAYSTIGRTSERSAADLAFTRFLRTGDASGLRETRADGTGLSSAPNDAGVSAGSTGNNAGYMVPQGFWEHLQVALKAYGGIANDYHRIDTETGNPMPWPTVDPTGVTAHLLGASNELNQLSVEDPYVFGQGMLNAWTIYAGPLLASLQLIQDSAFDVDNFVADRFGESIGRVIASLAVSGTGSGQPLGLITALNARGALSGASGGYYQLGAATTVKTFATSNPTELGGNVLHPTSLLGMVQGVDAAYYPGCKWYFNSTQAWGLRSVVDSNGRPLINFMNGLDADEVSSPDYSSNAPVANLFGFPVVIDNSIPNLTASTTGGPVFGNLDHAMVYRVARDTTVMRLVERYADYLAVGYVGYYRTDIRSNDLRAAVTVKAAAT
jgi:HK97 family phage major capsid protein